MKLAHACPVFCLIAVASAQYFSEGWKPGQPLSKPDSGTGYVYRAASTQNAEEAEGKPTSSPFDFSRILESGPLKALFNRAGVNISEKLEAARESTVRLWDDRIPLITDDNYNDIIANEKYTSLDEERSRVWFLVISVTRADREGVSRFVDQKFDSTFNASQIAGDLPNVRWGRIDYMNVTTITTKWSVWRAPVLVVLKDRGQTLRFYKPHQIRLNEDSLRAFLKQEAYELDDPWKSAFAPGGSREFVLDYLALALTKIYNVTVLIPRWLLVLLTGTVASMAINLLHSKKPPPAANAKKAPSNGSAAKRGSSALSSASTAPSTTSPAEAVSLKSGARQRKSAKR